MKGHIIYQGKYGATRQYAEWLQETLKIPVSKPKDLTNKEFKDADYLVIGSSVYVGKLIISNWLKKNASDLVNKKIFLFIVSATPAHEKLKLENFLTSVPAEIRYLIEIYYLPGKVIKKNLTLLDNTILHIGAWLTKDPVVKKRMLTDFDHLDISNLSELIDSIRSFEKSQEIDKYTVSY
ncbi:MAG: hypothetical protein H0V30_15825 [Chitinophagaceae bacterium]|nr:hypothetical protein [Chitinophagaceae bacterium]